jgi:hypothetical protein
MMLSEVSDKKIKSLTQADILDKINNRNVSQIFLKAGITSFARIIKRSR